MQIPHPRRPVGQPLHAHGPEHRLQRAHVTRLDPRARLSLIADDLLKALLAHRPQRQMIIQQAAQQLPPVNIKMLLKLAVREAGGVRPIKEADQRLEPLPARGKRITASRLARRAAAAAPSRGCILAVSPPGGQDFIARGVKFATTGVEIGGHAGHLRGRRGQEQRRLRHPTYESSHPPTSRQTRGKRPKTPATTGANRSTPGRSPPASPQGPNLAAEVTAPKPRIYEGFTVSSARPAGPLRRAAPVGRQSARTGRRRASGPLRARAIPGDGRGLTAPPPRWTDCPSSAGRRDRDSEPQPTRTHSHLTYQQSAAGRGDGAPARTGASLLAVSGVRAHQASTSPCRPAELGQRAIRGQPVKQRSPR